MTIDDLAPLFGTHQMMVAVAALFLINFSITVIEILLDLLPKKEGRRKGTYTFTYSYDSVDLSFGMAGR